MNGIIGKDSALKGFGLLLMVFVACLDIIFAQNRVVARINSILIAVEIGWFVYNLYIKWSKVNYNNKK